ncbi:MAG: TonB-dependent receptor [Candidatus Omnitrophota bacterium]
MPKKASAQGADLERIVVRKTLSSTPSHGVTTAVLSQEEIEKLPANTPEDLLTYLGADLQSRGPYGVKSDISLNGSTFQQVLVLVNGARVNDAQTAHHDLDLFFNLEDVERVEIIPASASVLYGPDGIGGAINFILKKPVEERSFLSFSGGDRGTSEQKGRIAYGLGAFRNSFSAGNAQSRGWRYDTDFRTDTFFHSSRWEKDGASLFFDAGYNEKAFGAYDFYTPGRGLPSKEWVNTKFFDVRGVLEAAGGLRFEPRVNFRRHHDKFMLDITRPDFYLNNHRTDSFLAGGSVSYSPQEEWRLALGADWGYENITSNNLGKHRREHWDVYIDPSWRMTPSSSLHLTLRLDDYSTFGTEATGGLTWKYLFENESEWYVTAGRTIRVPTFTELYYSDPTTDGNEDLKAEKAYNIESGWTVSPTKTTRVTLSAFLRREMDTIDFTKLSASDAKFMARNISRALAGGMNFYGRWEPGGRFAADLRYAYVSKKIDDDGLLYKYGLNYLDHLVVLGVDMTLAFGIRNRTEVVFKKKPARRGWTLINDRLSWSPKRDWEVFCQVDNLFNAEYQEIEGIPEPGRIAKFGVKYSW